MRRGQTADFRVLGEKEAAALANDAVEQAFGQWTQKEHPYSAATLESIKLVQNIQNGTPFKAAIP
jgi:hypothetical protein